MTRCKIPGENFGKLIEYKTIDITTIQGINQAEILKENGWIIATSNLFRIQYYHYVEDATQYQKIKAGKLDFC